MRCKIENQFSYSSKNENHPIRPVCSPKSEAKSKSHTGDQLKQKRDFRCDIYLFVSPEYLFIFYFFQLQETSTFFSRRCFDWKRSLCPVFGRACNMILQRSSIRPWKPPPPIPPCCFAVEWKNWSEGCLLTSTHPYIFAPGVPQNCIQTGHRRSEPYCTGARSFHHSFKHPYKMLSALASLFEITSTWLPIPLANSRL